MKILKNLDPLTLGTVFLWVIACFPGYGSQYGKESPGVYTVFEKDGRKGMKDSKGKTIIPPDYEDIGWSKGTPEPHSGTIGYKSDGLWGLINLENKKVTTAEYAILYPSGRGLLIAAKRGSLSHEVFFGLMNFSGKDVIPFRYHGLEHCGEASIAITKSGGTFLYSLIKNGGDTILPFAFDKIDALGSGLFAIRKSGGKEALYSLQEGRVSEFTLDSIGAYEKGYAIVHQGSALGVMDTEGKMAVLARYKSIERKGKQVTLWPFDHWEMISAQNEKVRTFSYDRVEPLKKGRFKVIANACQWLIDEQGQPLTPERYTFIDEIGYDKAIFRDGKKYGLLDVEQGPIVEAGFDSVAFIPPFIYTNRNEGGEMHWSVYDTFGIKKTRLEYERIKPYEGRFFAVRKRGHWGFVDRVGEEVIHCVYDSVGSFIGDHVGVKFHGEYGAVNRQNEWVILPQKDPVEVVNASLYLSRGRVQTQLRSFSGKLIYFTDNPIDNQGTYLIETLSSGKYWKIDFSGTIQQETGRKIQHFEAVFPPSEGFYGVKLDGKYGFIDDNELLRIANRYDGIGFFKEGVAPVKLMGKWGFIDKLERIKVQPRYEKVSSFEKGVSIVQRNGRYGLIDKKGGEIVPEGFDGIERTSNGKFIIYQSGKKGLLGSDGKALLNAKYDHIQDLDNGHAIVSRNGKTGLVTLKGVSTIPMIYDTILFDPEKKVYLCKKVSTAEELFLK